MECRRLAGQGVFYRTTDSASCKDAIGHVTRTGAAKQKLVMGTRCSDETQKTRSGMSTKEIAR
jgi:hypothetical protein